MKKQCPKSLRRVAVVEIGSNQMAPVRATSFVFVDTDILDMCLENPRCES